MQLTSHNRIGIWSRITAKITSCNACRPPPPSTAHCNAVNSEIAWIGVCLAIVASLSVLHPLSHRLWKSADVALDQLAKSNFSSKILIESEVSNRRQENQ